MDNNFPHDVEDNKSLNEHQPLAAAPARHGCVTAWLVFMLIANSIITLRYFTRAFFTKPIIAIPYNTLVILCIIGLMNTVFAITLLLWKKIGFYGFAVTAIITLVINVNIGISASRSLLGFAGVVVLYCILQIKQEGISAWDNLN